MAQEVKYAKYTQALSVQPPPNCQPFCPLTPTISVQARGSLLTRRRRARAGVLLNSIFPDWGITALLTLLLAFLTTRVLQRGQRLYRAENLERAETLERAGAPGAAGAKERAPSACASASSLAAGAGKENVAEEEEAGLGLEPAAGPPAAGRAQQAGSAAALLAVWAAFAGAQAGKARVERCSLAFLGLSLAQARSRAGGAAAMGCRRGVLCAPPGVSRMAVCH